MNVLLLSVLYKIGTFYTLQSKVSKYYLKCGVCAFLFCFDAIIHALRKLIFCGFLKKINSDKIQRFVKWHILNSKEKATAKILKEDCPNFRYVPHI